MQTQPLRLVFQAHNRRGLGHLMRGLNIAKAVHQLAPAAEITFYTRSASAAELCGPAFRCVADPEPEQSGRWPELLQDFAPDVVVYDTLLPAAREPALSDSTRTVYVMRKCKPERQRQIFASAEGGQIDRILIPHTPDEFGSQLPAALAPRSWFVGPIVRAPSPASQAALRARYQIAPGDFLLVSTPGGGGFAEDAASFFAAVQAAHPLIAQDRPNLRHLLLRGPHFTGALPALPGLTELTYEPDLVDLLALADLVIAEGGYNTVNEIRLARTPAIFLPGLRSYDDQAERVRELERRGLAAVFADRAAPGLAEQIAALAGSNAALSAMRASYTGDQLITGNRAAAEQIVALAANARSA